MSTVGLRTAYNTAEWLVQLYSDTDCGCRRQANLRLGFVFYTEKISTPSVLAVLVLRLGLRTATSLSAISG